MTKENKQILTAFMQRGYLLSPELLKSATLNKEFLNKIDTKIITKEKPVVIGKDVFRGVNGKGIGNINWREFEKSRVLHERGKTNRVYTSFLELLFDTQEEPIVEEPVVDAFEQEIPEVQVEEEQHTQEHVVVEQIQAVVHKEAVKEDVKEEIQPHVIDKNRLVTVLKSYEKAPKKWQVKDFTFYFKRRYQFLQQILQTRQELQNLTSIARIKTKQEREQVACVGLVYDKRLSKNGNHLISLEDPTGIITILAKPDVEGVDDICLDEVIAIKGSTAKNMVFAKTLFFPDIPVITKPKMAQEDAYFAVISDIHVGSQNFLEDKLLRFIDWLNLNNISDKEKFIAERVKYLFIVGDLVAGTGVYPHQESELVIKDLRSQYIKLAEYLSKIRNDITLIICPGNHDATRMAEPQPPLLKEFTAPLFELTNAVFVSSPAVVNIHKQENFEGFNVLMYHGSSFHYYNNSISHLREGDAKNHPHLTWQYLLKKRHLAPTHGATVYLPDPEEDGLLIDTVPDIVVNGDIHRSDLGNYNGVITISPSCWEKKSHIQERRGNEPDPGNVPFFNMKTRETTFIDFNK